MTLGSSVPARLTASTGDIYYVDKDAPGASDSNAGTSLTLPWATVNHAFQTAPANAIVYVLKTTTPYAETIVCQRGGPDSSHPITIAGYDAANRPEIRGHIELSGINCAHWRIQNLLLDANLNTYGWKVTITGSDHEASGVGASYIEFLDCEAYNTQGPGGGWLVTGLATNHVYWWNCYGHDNDPADTGAHGFYLNGGTDYHLMNCKGVGNGGYGFHLYLDPDRTNLKRVYLYNCDAVEQDGRGGYLIEGDGLLAANVPQDIHFYNCIGAFNAGTSGGWIFRAAHVTPSSEWSSVIPVTLDSCLTYLNPAGDVTIEQPLYPITQTGMISGDPKFTDQPGRDYTLLAGTDPRAEPTTVAANTLEGGTNGTTISTGNSGGTSGTAFGHVSIGGSNTLVYDTAHAQGTLAAKMTFGGTSTGEFGFTSLGSLTSAVYYRCVFAFSAVPTVGNWFDFIRLNTNSGSARCCSAVIRTDGKLRIDDRTGTQINSLTSTTVLSPNTLYRLELKVVPSTTVGTVDYWLYDDITADITSYVESRSATGLALGANIDELWFGNPSTAANTAGLSGWWDSMAVSTQDRLGPLGGTPFIVNPALDAGNEAYTPPTDFDGRLRGAADLGAYRYTEGRYDLAFPSTFQTIQDDVIARLNLDATNDLSSVKDWINQAYSEVCVMTDANVQTGTKVLTAGTATYDISTFLGNAMIHIHAITVTSNGVVYAPLTQTSLDEILQMRVGTGGAATATGTVTRYALVGQNTLELYPTPASADTLTIWYSYQPTPLSANSDVPAIPEPYATRCLTFGALAQGSDLTGDPSGPDYGAQFQAWVAKFQQHLNRRRGTQPGQFKPFRGGAVVAHDPATIGPFDGSSAYA